MAAVASLIASPKPPTKLVACRSSDAQATLSWTNSSSTSAPYTSVQIEMQTDADTASWVSRYNGTPVTSRSVTGLAADHRYRWRVRATNSVGSSAWVLTAWLCTTPAAPTGVSLTRVAVDVVTGKWAAGSRYRTWFELQCEANQNGTWQAWANITGLSASRTATNTTAWRFRVRNVITNVPTSASATTTLYSAWVTSPTVYAAPAAPTGIKVARISDTQQQVSWTNTAPTSALAPYTNLVLERQTDTEQAAWLVVATLGVVTSQASAGTEAGHQYRYRVKARNTGGDSACATSAWIKTTPAPPTGLAVVKAGAQIALSWTNSTVAAGSVEIQDSPDGTGFVDVATTTDTGAGYTVAGVDVLATHRYRIRAVAAGVPLAAGGTAVLCSAWVESEIVEMLAPPAAPTVTLSTMLADITRTPVVVEIVHNSIDTTIMQAANLRYRLVDAPEWQTIANPGPSYDLGPLLANGAQYEVQAQTKGEHPAFGPWCASVILDTSATPTATIIAPAEGDTIPTTQLTVRLGFADPDSIAQQWALQLLDDTLDVVWQTTGIPGATSEYTLPYRLGEGLFVIRAQVQDSASLWSDWVQAGFNVAYPKPPAVVAAARWVDEDGSIVFDLEIPAPDPNQVPAQTVELWRYDDNNLSRLVASAPVADQSWISLVDPIPPLSECRYRILAISAIPSQSQAEQIVADPPGRWIYVNAGPDWATVAKLRIDPSIDTTPVSDKTLIQFDGRQAPVEFQGKVNYRTVALTGRVAADGQRVDQRSEWTQWDAIADMGAPVCYRDHLGRRLFGSISVDRLAHSLAPSADISATITEVDYAE